MLKNTFQRAWYFDIKLGKYFHESFWKWEFIFWESENFELRLSWSWYFVWGSEWHNSAFRAERSFTKRWHSRHHCAHRHSGRVQGVRLSYLVTCSSNDVSGICFQNSANDKRQRKNLLMTSTSQWISRVVMTVKPLYFPSVHWGGKHSGERDFTPTIRSTGHVGILPSYWPKLQNTALWLVLTAGWTYWQ